MASRMDRYYQSNNKRIDRSTKNKDLYKKVNTNSKDIASISSINRYNEIDISKIKDIVNNRETYKRHYVKLCKIAVLNLVFQKK